ncbi:MAG: RteC domain-containing protein [Paludibacter sp.]|nr:RteC domain-containing protein [Paludibacter sp.]
MENFTRTLLTEIENQIKKIENDEKNRLTILKMILKFLDGRLQVLKEFVINYEFQSEEEEIKFFKEQKPKIWSNLIYYLSVYKIEINRPRGSVLTVEAYLMAELDRIKHFFDRNVEIYHYYRTDSIHFDKYYFLRNRDIDIPVNLACFYYERDVRFSTGYDYKISKIIANDLIELHINSELFKLKMEPEHTQTDFPVLQTRETWTATKTDLVELIYALYTAKCIDYGNIKLNALTAYMENIFNISIGDIYRIFLEIRGRKGNRTQFFDRLGRLD